MKSLSQTIGLLLTFCFTKSLVLAQECKPLDAVDNFDLEEYASKPWYSHQQAVNSYSPIEDNYCVRAEYGLREESTFWGYTVDVKNRALRNGERERRGNLCAYYDTDQNSKLAVAPCFLPKAFAGPYWVVAYNEEEGYALISGGEPKLKSFDEETGEFLGCKTGTGTNNSGLWIFLRTPERNMQLIKKVRGIATELGFDVSVLNDVVHDDRCPYPIPTPMPTISSYIAPSSTPSITTSSSPTVSYVPTFIPSDEDDCKDTEGDFYVLFVGRRNCEWIGENSRWLRCLFYNDYCPETCGVCEA